MTKEEFKTVREELLIKCEELIQSKGHDYTKGNEDVLSNFKEGKSLGLSSIQTCGVFMKKHTDAIFNFIRTNGKKQSEPIKGRIEDCINYLIFLNSVLYEEENNHYEDNHYEYEA